MLRPSVALMLILSILPVAGIAAKTRPINQDRQSDKAATISARTAGLQKIDGYIPLYWDNATGKMFMEISRFNSEFLYQVSLPAGLGSNPIGLDRGQLGASYVVYFERVGPKVLMVAPNYRYRAITDNGAERRAVEDSFAKSVIWGFKIDATEGERVLVDATTFFLRDGHGVIDRLRQSRQGQYRFDESRSAFYLPRTKAFPKNTEVETTLTFTADGGDAGALVREIVPMPQSLTVREHYSLVELPDNKYAPRRLDPRVGAFGIEFYDFATGITEPVEKRWIERHRLQKRDATAAISEPVEPIVYYVDNGAPEPIRSALVEGASWWSQAFEAAGFRNAFQVKVLPADADPMDLRYNMISWVHRSTRGWSYGASVVDPRTGEIIKGNVTLGSLRERQDYLIGSGLVAQERAFADPIASPDGANGACDFGMLPDVDYLADLDPSNDVAKMALARIRQLAAHEVGHTLGLAHNFAASTYGRASVMDYPSPTVEIKNGKIDLSNAYTVGIGAYDKFAITFAYAQFTPGANEGAELEAIVSKGLADGMLFISDADSRPAGAAHPLSNLWDTGADPIVSLRHEMEVRRIGLSQFGLANLQTGMPLSMLEAKLLPLYLHHRYQLQAAVKSVGGINYTYAIKTANGPSPAQVQEVVPAARQWDALDAVLDTIKTDELVIPARIRDMIPPTAFGYGESRTTTELFNKRTDPAFDPIAAATIAADMTISGLLEPHRAARLLEFHADNRENPGFNEVVDKLIARTWQAPMPKDGYAASVARAVQSLVVTRLMDLAAEPDASVEVRAVASESLRKLEAKLKAMPPSASEAAHIHATYDDIERFLTRPDMPRKQTAPLAPPPGDPIGGRARPN